MPVAQSVRRSIVGAPIAGDRLSASPSRDRTTRGRPQRAARDRETAPGRDLVAGDTCRRNLDCGLAEQGRSFAANDGRSAGSRGIFSNYLQFNVYIWHFVVHRHAAGTSRAGESSKASYGIGGSKPSATPVGAPDPRHGTGGCLNRSTATVAGIASACGSIDAAPDARYSVPVFLTTTLAPVPCRALSRQRSSSTRPSQGR